MMVIGDLRHGDIEIFDVNDGDEDILIFSGDDNEEDIKIFSGDDGDEDIKIFAVDDGDEDIKIFAVDDGDQKATTRIGILLVMQMSYTYILNIDKAYIDEPFELLIRISIDKLLAEQLFL